MNDENVQFISLVDYTRSCLYRVNFTNIFANVAKLGIINEQM